MDFIKTHKTYLIIGISSFVVGYISGGIMEARSFEQQLTQNIFNRVTEQQKSMQNSREEFEKRFNSIPSLDEGMEKVRTEKK